MSEMIAVEHGILGQWKWIHGSSKYKLELSLQWSQFKVKAFLVAYSYSLSGKGRILRNKLST